MFHPKTTLSLAGLALLAAGFGVAYAYSGDGPGWGHRWHGMGFGGGRHGFADMLAGIDADRNGAVSFGEVEARITARMVPYDLNKDGGIDRAEIDAAVKARTDLIVSKLMRRFDGNNDGKISTTEVAGMAKERFSWHDLDDDGSIGAGELPPAAERLISPGP